MKNFFLHCYSYASKNLYNEWPQIHLSDTLLCSSFSSVNRFKLARSDQIRPDDWIYWINTTMCTVYDEHNHHHYTHTWIHLDQSWDSKKKMLKRLKLKRKSLLFAGLSTKLQSTIIVDKCSSFEITLYKNAWDLKEEWEKKPSSERNRVKERNIRV